MKVLASVVTTAFLVAGAFIPAIPKSETGISMAKAYAQDKPIVDTKLQDQARVDYTISWYQDQVVKMESGWRTDAINASSGACGLFQALPCSKLGCPLDDSGFDCQMAWGNAYVQDRYGSWEAAYEHEISYHWY